MPLAMNDAPSCVSSQNLIKSPGFEVLPSNPVPWLEVSTGHEPRTDPNQPFPYSLVNETSAARYSGQKGLGLGSPVVQTAGQYVDEFMMQAFVVPRNMQSISWTQRGKLNNTSVKYPAVEIGDAFKVAVLDATTGLPLPLQAGITLDSQDNYLLNQWFLLTVTVQGLDAYAGRTVAVSYSFLSDADSENSFMYVDDVVFATSCR